METTPDASPDGPEPRPDGEYGGGAGGADRRGSGGVGGSGASGEVRARLGRRLTVGVALVEATLVAAGAAASLLAGLQGGSLVLGAAVAGVAAGVAWLLVEAARGFARGRRWPTGVFVTAQLLVGLVALSLGGRALLTLTDNPRIGVVTLTALALAVTGLVGVRLLLAGRADEPAPDDAAPPVY